MTRPQIELKFSLRLSHPTMSPSKISQGLGMRPDFQNHVGNPRQTPTGEPLEGIYHDTLWSRRVKELSHSEFDAFLPAFITRLEKKSSFLKKFIKTGGEAEFFIGWFVMRNTEGFLDYDLLARLGKLGISLWFDVHPADKPQRHKHKK